MFRELLRVLLGEDPERDLTEESRQMRTRAAIIVREANRYYWKPPCTPEQRQAIYDQDIEINKLERSIRKRLVTLLADSSSPDHAHWLVVMSMVKDVERIGDYAKNLVEAAELCCDPLPEDDNVTELAQIWEVTDRMLDEVQRAVQAADTDLAQELNARGRATLQRCDALIEAIARADYSAGLAVKLALGTRYYKRICGHLVNVLSSVLMPLHKLDYFDEKLLMDDFD
jgi:phosphate transport system protein